MQWNQSTMYEQRVRFILEVQQGTFSFAESCRRSSPPQGRVRRKKVRRRKARLNPTAEECRLIRLHTY